MSSESRPIHPLRGGSRLVVHATHQVIDLVEEMHRTIASGPRIPGSPLPRLARAWTGATYGTIRGLTRSIGAALDAALGQLEPLLWNSPPGPQREALLAALNGVVGDVLLETGNPLAIPMTLRSGGSPLDLEAGALKERFSRATPKLLVLVHGSSMSDASWSRSGHDHGAALARDLGYTPIYVRYNSGLHISTNGAELAGLLEQLLSAWPVPVEELSILAHSMGGLVARSACLAAEEQGLDWRHTLRRFVTLGSPHHGALLERGGSWFELLLGVSRYSAPFARLGRLRSAGIIDLRFGNVLDEHWRGFHPLARMMDRRQRLSLPAGVECFAIAATRSPATAKRLSGDGLVSVESALGRHAKRELTLAFPEANQWIAHGAGHLDLLDRPEVYARLLAWLSPHGAGPPSGEG